MRLRISSSSSSSPSLGLLGFFRGVDLVDGAGGGDSVVGTSALLLTVLSDEGVRWFLLWCGAGDADAVRRGRAGGWNRAG